MNAFAVFAAVVVVVAITVIAGVIITNTADVDSLADPAPRPGEDGHPDDAGWPRVPDKQMRIIDAALPKDQAWDRWVQYREAEKQ